MVRVGPDRVRERSGEGPGIRAREGVRRREQGRDGQAPRDGRVREVGVLDDRGAGGPQTQRSVRDTGSEILYGAKDRWPGRGQRPCPPGCSGRASCAQAGRRPTGSVAAAGGTAAESGTPRGRRWCQRGPGSRGTVRSGGTRPEPGAEPGGSGPAGRARGASSAGRAGQPGGASTAGPLLSAARAGPVATGSAAAWPTAATARRAGWTGWVGRAPAWPAWRPASRAAPGQQPLQPDRYRHGPGAPPGPAAEQPARTGAGSTVRAGRPEAWRRRVRPAHPGGHAAAGRPTAQPEQHATTPGGRP
jgi:hypothetical protein